MTTTYGMIPTSYHASPVVDDLESISSTKQRIIIKAKIPSRRLWRVMLDFHFMGLPRGVSDACSRIKTNHRHFRLNYMSVILIVILVSLFKHPISFMVFTIMVSMWTNLIYVLRDEPIKLFRYQINDRVVLSCLTLISVVLLFLTNATLNTFVASAFLIGVLLVLIHAVVRKTDDLFLDEEAMTTETSWSRYNFIFVGLFLSSL